MNIVVIMTDTQNQAMVGAYGNPKVDTPNLDRLAATGMRFDRAYTTCPLCTPARAGIFTGTHPVVNGAWCNNVPPGVTFPLMGSIFKHYGYRAAHTGKWHLDGSAYFGDGEAGGGFEPDWWYDGKKYLEDIGPEKFKANHTCKTPAQLRAAGLDATSIWGHRVADRAIDFLGKAGPKEPFLLVVSFDEPHVPHVAPPEYWERFDMRDVPRRPNFGAPLEGKPQLQNVHRRECPVDIDGWEEYRKGLQIWYACNAYIDREIGRVVDAVEALHGDDTVIVYTSDHGAMMGSHGQHSKGPMMYEEITNIPFIIKAPGCAQGVATRSLASHVDIMPTILELAGIPRPESLHGVSLVPTLKDPQVVSREMAMISFTRFEINSDGWGEFYPIRCMTDGRHKLSINLFETDELYDLATDPYEMQNIVNVSRDEAVPHKLHDAILLEMDRIRDPFRGFRWGAREWRTARTPRYHAPSRNAPKGFPFQPVGLEW